MILCKFYYYIFVIRIAGVNIPRLKALYISLTYIYGIGISRSIIICNKSNVNPRTRVCNLDIDSINNIRKTINSLYIVEGDLRNVVSSNIKNLVDINSYRGIRHQKKLPLRGQRTHTNARTKKGKRIAISIKKKSRDKK